MLIKKLIINLYKKKLLASKIEKFWLNGKKKDKPKTIEKKNHKMIRIKKKISVKF